MKRDEVLRRLELALWLLLAIRGRLEGDTGIEVAFVLGELAGVCQRAKGILEREQAKPGEQHG